MADKPDSISGVAAGDILDVGSQSAKTVVVYPHDNGNGGEACAASGLDRPEPHDLGFHMDTGGRILARKQLQAQDAGNGQSQ